MKTISLFLMTLCVIAMLACKHSSNNQVVTTPPPTPSSTIANANTSGGLTAAESGETSQREFEGTTAVTEKRRASVSPALLKDVRTGTHGSYDRVVFEFEGSAVPGYHIEYVDKPASCGEGEVVRVAGKRFLVVQMMPANAHTEAGSSSIANRQQSPNLSMLKELKLSCDLEADVSWVLGVSEKGGYRVMELINPARLVIDVAHERAGL